MTEIIRANVILNGRTLIQKEPAQGILDAVYLAQDMQNRRSWINGANSRLAVVTWTVCRQE